MSAKNIHAIEGELYSHACARVLTCYLYLDEKEQELARETDAYKEAMENFNCFPNNVQRRGFFGDWLVEEIKKHNEKINKSKTRSR